MSAVISFGWLYILYQSDSQASEFGETALWGIIAFMQCYYWCYFNLSLSSFCLLGCAYCICHVLHCAHFFPVWLSKKRKEKKTTDITATTSTPFLRNHIVELKFKTVITDCLLSQLKVCLYKNPRTNPNGSNFSVFRCPFFVIDKVDT